MLRGVLRLGLLVPAFFCAGAAYAQVAAERNGARNFDNASD